MFLAIGLGEFEKPASELAFGNCERTGVVLVKVSVISDEPKGQELKPGKAIQNGPRFEYPLRVEVYSLASDRHGEIEPAAGRQNSLQGGYKFENMHSDRWVRVRAKPEVFL